MRNQEKSQANVTWHHYHEINLLLRSAFKKGKFDLMPLCFDLQEAVLAHLAPQAYAQPDFSQRLVAAFPLDRIEAQLITISDDLLGHKAVR